MGGGDLQKCSGAGSALTGFTRTGHCTDRDDDAGSHHICIDMKANAGGNFCEVTGQPDWCSSSMACDGSPSQMCPVEHWCVCQWAFASYLERAGGCDKIRNVVCEAVRYHTHANVRAMCHTSRSSSLDRTDQHGRA